MNIILTGAIGFVGGEVLQHLLAHPDITGVTCLSRKPLPQTSPKLKTIIMQDFGVYDEALVEQLSAHDACIWTLGGKASDLGHTDDFIRVTHTYTLALASAMAATTSKPFRFCYLSGMGADQSESAWLPWEKLTRHLKGRTEKDLLKLQDRYPCFSVNCMRPGGILPRDAGAMSRLLLAPIAIGVETLAEGMITAATHAALFRTSPVTGNSGIRHLAKIRHQ